MAQDLLALLERSAAGLATTAQDRLTERGFQKNLEEVSGRRPQSVHLAHWPRVGPVDLMLPGRIAAELKWSDGDATLGNCAWDVAKLATMLAERVAIRGFIVAGAPTSHWTTSADGVALFHDDEYLRDAIVRQYESWWRFWCRHVMTRPIALPQAIAVRDAGAIPTVLAGAAWTLRAAEVIVLDPRWRKHVCPHKWREEPCQPRPWDEVAT